LLTSAVIGAAVGGLGRCQQRWLRGRIHPRRPILFGQSDGAADQQGRLHGRTRLSWKRGSGGA
jgi:hypothetical protein